MELIFFISRRFLRIAACIPGRIRLILLFLLLLKPAAQAQAGKSRILYKLLSQPHKYQRHRKLKNTTQGSKQRLSAPINQVDLF